MCAKLWTLPEKGQDVARFLVDNDNPTGYSQALSEVNADATKTTENYYYGVDFGPLAQVHNPGAAGFDQRFLYGDHLSTTRLLTRSLSSDQYSSYSPYGAMTQPAGGSSLTSYAFTGQSRDLDTGLQYHRARWLSAGIGRWLSEDPREDFVENLSNPYAAVGNRPCVASDPLGALTLGEMGVSFAVAASLTAIWKSGNVLWDSVVNNNYSSYTGFDTGWGILVDSFWAGVKAALTGAIAKGFTAFLAGGGGAAATFPQEVAGIFVGYAVSGGLIYSIESLLLGKKKFSLTGLLTYMLIEGFLGTIGTVVVFKMLPRDLRVSVLQKGDEAAAAETVSRAVKIAYSIAIVKPFVNYSQQQLEWYYENLAALERAAAI